MDTVAEVRGRDTTRRELLSASGDGVGRVQSARGTLSSEIVKAQLVGTKSSQRTRDFANETVAMFYALAFDAIEGENDVMENHSSLLLDRVMRQDRHYVLHT